MNARLASVCTESTSLLTLAATPYGEVLASNEPIETLDHGKGNNQEYDKGNNQTSEHRPQQPDDGQRTGTAGRVGSRRRAG